MSLILKAIGINPSNMDYETTFVNILKKRKPGFYNTLFIGQGDFTGNVVVNVRNFDFIPDVGETFIEKGFLSASINKFLLRDNSKFKVLSNDGRCCELLLV